MGVPGFFGWLIRQYKENKMVKKQLDERTNILYIDANCLVHPQCKTIIDNYKDETNIDRLEKNMFARISNYLNFLFAYCNPADEFFIAVDGSAPLAKINQQRRRRTRAIDDNHIRNTIKRKYGVKTNTIWDNTQITPGTEFMERLHNHLLSYCGELSKKYPAVKITYSSYHTYGEGEHKILEDIRYRKKNDTEFEKKNVAIYGLDADLIFLSLSSQKQNIYLLREANQIVSGHIVPTELYDPVIDVAEELLYVSIDDMRKCYVEQIIKNLVRRRCDQENSLDNQTLNEDNVMDNGYKKISNYEFRQLVEAERLKLTNKDEISFVNDFVILCYFLGNDFLPHLPSLDIKRDGLDMVLDAYIDTYCFTKIHLIDNNHNINTYMLTEIIRLLGDKEEEYFCEIKPKMDKRFDRRSCPVQDPMGIELWNLENLKDIKKYMKNIDTEDPIRFGEGPKDLWKFRYYEHHFGISEYQKEHINRLCENYLEGLIWVTRYYFEGCCSWTWQYNFLHAPFLSDFFEYLDKSNIKDINQLTFNLSIPLSPCVQLLAVLPTQCANELPKRYRDLVRSASSPIIDLYPTKVKLDIINKDQLWQAIPLIPELNVKRILSAVNGIKLDASEIVRNTILDNFIFGLK